MDTVQQTETTVKTDEQPIQGPVSVAYAWGMEDAQNGVSKYEGYMFFCGYLLTDYLKGHEEGNAIMLRKQIAAAVEMPVEFVGALADHAAGIRYCAKGIDWAAIEDEPIGD